MIPFLLCLVLSLWARLPQGQTPHHCHQPTSAGYHPVRKERDGGREGGKEDKREGRREREGGRRREREGGRTREREREREERKGGREREKEISY